MPYEHFGLLFYENFLFNLSIIFFVMLTILLIYRKNIYSLFDPLLYFLIFSSAGYSVVFILFFSEKIDSYYVVHFLMTQIALIIGFLLFKPINLKRIKQTNYFFHLRITRRIKAIYVISSILYIVAHLILYIFKGIPLFMFSRLDATTGGFGLVSSISITTSIIVLTMLSYKYFLRFKFGTFDYIMIVMFIICSILSGSKSVFIGSIFIMFYVAYFISVKLSAPIIIKKFNKIAYKIFLLAAVSSVLILFLLFDENPLIKIIFRIVMTGDIFMMAYVDNNIEELKGNFLNLALPYKLVDILGLEHVRAIGNQLITIVYGSMDNSGPNARHNIFGYLSFGYMGSILFSFLIGLLIGFLRNKLIVLMKRNLESLTIFVLILSGIFSIETDFNNAIFSYISKIIVFVPIYLLSYIVTNRQRKVVNNV